ncbi:MAG: hypothetical protein WAM28_06500 [Chlamydiales bacterium]
MKDFPPTIVIRHRKENLKKCTLRGLEQRSDFNFFTYPTNRPFPIEDYILLTLDAPELTISDQTKGLLVLDGTWRYVQAMEQNLCLPSSLIGRSLPASLKTAYPRRQTDCSDPKRGLASIEAIVAAYSLLGRKIDGLLDNYYWKETFLEKNAFLCKT